MAQDLYRNRDFIPDFDEILAETAARSQEFAARHDLRPNLFYGSSPREKLDLLLPGNLSKGAPVHMFIHGGYWRSGQKEDHHLVAAPVLAAGGICAVATYDLMPGTRLDAIVAQIRKAAAFLQRIAPDHGADPQRFTVSGHSAGAHLASYLAAKGRREADRPALPNPQALLLVSGLYDLSEIPDSFLKSEAEMTHAEAADWSPISAEQSPGPHRILAYGEQDTPPFHDQAERFEAELSRQRLPVTRRVEPGLNHLTVVLALGDPQSAIGTLLGGCVADS